MITRPTVLVLGAGASAPFKFPAGRDLLNQIQAECISPVNKFGRDLMNCGFEPEFQVEFARALKYSGRSSVDAFLEGQPEFAALGKSAIARALVPHEIQDRLFGEEDNWYRKVWNLMADRGLEHLKQNQLSFLTFNYDRSLEQFLFSSLQNSYGLSDGECADRLLKAVPMIHLHGQLGGLPPFDIDGRGYDSLVTTDIIKKCASAIRVIHETLNVEEDDAFCAARDVLREASVVCFLGFGYHRTNLERLGIPGIIEGKTVYGSAYGIGAGDRQRIENLLLHGVKLTGPSWRALQFLEETRVFVEACEGHFEGGHP